MTKSLVAAVIAITLLLGGGLAMAEIANQSDEPESEPVECVPSETETCEEEGGTEDPETCEPTDEVTCEDEPEEVDEDEGSDEVSTEGEPEPEQADLVVEDEFKNHGEAVSTAAHECPTGPEHGACVSEVAKSDAGTKDHDSEIEADSEADPEAGSDGEDGPGKAASKGPQGSKGKSPKN